jgi:RNA polymerase sigma-70 factor (ECF subfamily)
VNVARARRRRESRFISFTSLLGRLGNDSRRPSVDPERFESSGHWRVPPPSWSELPEDVLESRETRAEVQAAIDMLAPGLREVIVLRDVAGWSSDEVCDVLRISPANQRVRLNRASTAVRQKLENRFR